jgi:hypothetical protein
MLDYLQPFSSVEYDTTGFTALFGRSAALSNALGKIDGAVFDKIAAPQWRYIMFGVARK